MVVGVKMADSAPPRAKKAKIGVPVFQVSAEKRAKQFNDNLFVDSGVLFCRFW